MGKSGGRNKDSGIWRYIYREITHIGNIAYSLCRPYIYGKGGGENQKKKERYIHI